MKAAKYFEKSSSVGSAKSMYEYGKMLQKGIGCKKNEIFSCFHIKILQIMEVQKIHIIMQL